MATNMDTVERLPFRPFSLDTRNLLNSVNRNRHMEYLSTLLVSRKLKKCEEWLKEITYSRLVDIEDHFLDAIENDNTDFVEGGRPSLATGITYDLSNAYRLFIFFFFHIKFISIILIR